MYHRTNGHPLPSQKKISWFTQLFSFFFFLKSDIAYIYYIYILTGVSVGVSSFTLVAISLERYFAICRPLQSRKWQTLSHAYRSILLIWGVACVIMIPIPVHTNHENRRPGMYTCREKWEAELVERIYTVFLVLMLLLIPLIAMSVAYGIVMHTLYEDIAVPRETNGKTTS